MTSEPIWRLAPGQRLMHRCHDGECVLFNDLSGDTHLLTESVLDLLQALRAAPRAASALAEADAASLADLEDVLADLAALYLVEAQPC